MLSYVSENKKHLTSDGIVQIWGEINNYLKAGE
jgi:hypothetical protein